MQPNTRIPCKHLGCLSDQMLNPQKRTNEPGHPNVQSSSITPLWVNYKTLKVCGEAHDEASPTHTPAGRRWGRVKVLEGDLHCHFFLLLLLLSTVALPRHFDLARRFASAQHAGIMNLFSSCTTAPAPHTYCIRSSVSRSTATARALNYSSTPPTQKCHDRSHSSGNLDSCLTLKESAGPMGRELWALSGEM